MSVFIPAASTVGPSTTLEALQVLEKLGGSAGYLEHLQKPPSISGRELAKSVDLAGWVSTICEVKLGKNPIWTWADLHTLDGHRSRLEGWGYADAKTSCGKLFCIDWDEMMREPVRFEAIAGDEGEGGRLNIWFSRGIQPIGRYVGHEANLPRVHLEGTCTWEPEMHTDV